MSSITPAAGAKPPVRRPGCGASRLIAVYLVAIVGLAMLATSVGFAGTAAAAGNTAPDCGSVSYTGAGTPSTPYQVGSVDQLQCIEDQGLDKHYELTSDIDASETSSWNGEGENAKGFTPIGDGANRFTGTFDGGGHTISGLTVDRVETNDVGLFGSIGTGGLVKNVGLEGGSITGDNTVGGVAGESFGTVKYTYAASSVSGDGNSVGGLVAFNPGTVENSYATGSVSGKENVGGLVGLTAALSTIERSYATGSVSGTSEVGGLVGDSEFGTVENSYWDKGTTNQDDAIGVGSGSTLVGFGSTGDLSPASQMQGSSATSNMNKLDFTSTWETVSSGETDATADGYPILSGLDRTKQLQAQGIYDTPIVSSITRDDSSPTNADSVALTVAFSKSVSGVDADDFTLTTTKTATTANGDNDVSLTGTGSSYTVTVANVEGDGDLELELVDDDSITDGNGVPLGGSGTAGSADGSYTSGEPYTIDNTAPTVDSITRPSPSSQETNADSVEFQVSFSESVNNVDDGDFKSSGSASGTIDSVDSSSGSTITVTVDQVSGDGSLGLDIASGTDITDAASNSLDISEPDTDETYTIDQKPPGISEVTITDDTDNNGYVTTGDTVEITATVTDANTISSVDADASAYDAGTVTLSDDGSNSAPDDDQYSATVTVGKAPTEGDQSVSVSATDAAGNGGSQAAASGTITVDTTGPTFSAGGTTAVSTDEGTTGTVLDVDADDDTGTSYDTDVSYALSGTDVAAFSIDSSTGQLSLDSARDFENPTDSDVNNDYELTVTATDDAGNTNTQDVTVTITDVDDERPTAEAGSDRRVNRGVSTTLDGTGSTDNVGIVSYEWDFDDGTTGLGSTPVHTFESTGTYTVALTVADAAGNTDTDTLTVTVIDANAPVADLEANRSVVVGESVTFDASGSTDDERIDSYEWDFDDDGTYEASGSFVTHAFGEPGNRTVRLRVTDGAGNTDTDTVTVSVERAPDTTPPSVEAGTNRTVGVNETLRLNGSASADDRGIATFEWDVDGDGSYETNGSTASTTFGEPGTYVVRVRVTDRAGNTGTDALTVTVRDPVSTPGELFVDLTPATATVTGTAAVTVTVTDAETGNPVTNATVEVPGLEASGRTNATGTVTLAVEPCTGGTYPVAADADGYAPANATLTVDGPRPGQAGVDRQTFAAAAGEDCSLGRVDVLTVVERYFGGDPVDGVVFDRGNVLGLVQYYLSR